MQRSSIIAACIMLAIVGYSAYDYFRTREISAIGPYELNLPDGFRVIAAEGLDSFVGQITDDSITIYYDYGWYADPLMLSKAEYARTKAYLSSEELYNRWDRFDEEEITISKQIYFDSTKFEWVVSYLFNDSIRIEQAVDFPEQYDRYEEILEDSTTYDYRKLVLPKDGMCDYTGFYMRERYCGNWQCNALSMVAHNVRNDQREKVLEVFRSIQRIKKE